MTRQADQFFLQQQLKELNLDKPAFVHRPVLLGARPGTPEHEQFDSTREDTEEDEGNATSALDAELHMPAWARRWMPQGTWLARPQLIGANEGIVP